MVRLTWLRSGAGWSACFLLAGCLGNNHRAEPDPAVVRIEQTAGPASDKVVVSPPEMIPPPPQPTEPKSNYNPQPEPRNRASIDPSVVTAGHKDEPKPPPVEVSPPQPPKDAPLVAALRLVLEKHPREVQALLKQYDKTDRDLLEALLSLTAEVGAGELDKLPSREVERTLEQLHYLTMHLRQRAPLELGKVCFCREIENFGQYTPLPADYEFQAGYGDQAGERVVVYAEVRNFGMILHNGKYENRLLGTLSIHKAGARRGDRNIALVEKNLDISVDRSLTPRQDYFLNIRFHVFPRLPPGLYTLWITVKDVTPGQPFGSRMVTRSLDFKVCPPGLTAR